MPGQLRVWAFGPAGTLSDSGPDCFGRRGSLAPQSIIVCAYYLGLNGVSLLKITVKLGSWICFIA